MIKVKVIFCYDLRFNEKDYTEEPKIVQDIIDLDKLIQENFTVDYLDYLGNKMKQLKKNDTFYVCICLKKNEIIRPEVISYCLGKILTYAIMIDLKYFLESPLEISPDIEYSFIRFFKDPKNNEEYINECNINGEMIYPKYNKGDLDDLVSNLNIIEYLYKYGRTIGIDKFRFLYHNAITEYMEGICLKNSDLELLSKLYKSSKE